MNYLDSLVLPQSSEHIQLLHYLLVLVQFLFLPFYGAALVGAFLSLKYWKKGTKENNSDYLRYSKDIIEIISVNKSFGISIGILPVITSILIYVQLLHKSDSKSIVIMLIALPLLIIGLILIYTFRYALAISDLFDEVTETNIGENVKVKFRNYKFGSSRLAKRSGIIGVALLTVGLWYYVSAVSYGIYTDFTVKSSAIKTLFSTNSLLTFFQFMLISSAAAGAAILFAFFYWEGREENLSDSYRNLIKNISLKTSLTALILLPLILFVNMLLLPKESLSGSVFTYTIIAIGLIFISYHLLYSISKTSNLKISGHLFFVVMFAFLSIIIKDQLTVSNTTKLHSAALSLEYNTYLSELKGESSGVTIRSGEEIYKVICSACHKFDEKLVGPPYNKVLVKYEGKMDQLIGFILNPVKVDPAFPPMPNQGLRRDEAKNIAEYLMEQHLKSSSPK